MRSPWMPLLLLLQACVGHRAGPTVHEPAPSATPAVVGAVDEPAPEDQRTVTWTVLRGEIEALVCLRTIESPDGTKSEMPWSGDREICGLPPAQTTVERAVAAAFEAARPATISLTAEKHAAQAVVRSRSDERRIVAMREAMLSEAYLGMLLPRLYDGLEAEGIECRDCPTAVRPRVREVEWATLEPYLAAHVWPNPVVTPRDERGRPTGKPTLSVHVCVGINGIARMEAPDPALIRAAYLGVFHTEAVREAVIVTLGTVTTERAYGKLRTDDERTEHLRAQVGPRTMAEPAVRNAVCETLQRFEPDTGVLVVDCAVPRPDSD
jgi:hypothetical protein